MNASVQKWLDELTVAPSAALQKLVLGYAGVTAWSRSSLRESIIEIFQSHANVLDAAVAAWLEERLMKLPPEKTSTLVWASRLQELFSALAGLPLPLVACLLRDRLRDFRSWLRPLRTDESLDPEAAYLAALAWADTNQRLEGMWQGLALRRDREPAYYTDIGLLGLRKTRDERGQLPSKVPFLLLATLIEIADLLGQAQKDWLLTARALLGGYHYSVETWIREFEPILAARQDAEHGPQWLKKVLPQLRAEQQVQQHGQHSIPPTHPLHEKDAMIAEVAKHGPESPGDRLTVFLERERAYANATRNPYFLVRTFNRLAEAARIYNPGWAIVIAEESLAWDENNARNWTVLARALWTRGIKVLHNGGFTEEAEKNCREAIDILWKTRFRFPWEPKVRNELARLHRDACDFKTAEIIYRETAAEFPDNTACRNGLADVLLKSGRLSEAEALYRETRSLFRSDSWSRNSLAEILIHRSAISHDEVEREEARCLFQEAVKLNDPTAQSRLAGFDQRWQRISSQESLYTSFESNTEETIALSQTSPAEMRPAPRLGHALLFQWQACRPESAKERELLFAEAEAMLDLPDELTGECRSAFIEARGFLLLARDRANEARVYFEQRIAAFTRPPLGLLLGFAEARVRLGEALSEDDEAKLDSFGPEGSILPLVLKAVRLLESTASDEVLRDLLLELYPLVRELAGMPASELGEEDEPAEPTTPARRPETPDSMMAQLLIARVFRPATINTFDDLQIADSIPRVRASLRAHREDILSIAEKLALAAF